PGAMQRGATAFAWALGDGGTAQRDVLAPAPYQRIVRGGGPKLLDGGNARIYTEQALLRARGQVSKDLRYGLLARDPKASAAHHADPDPPQQDHGCQCGHEVGLHRSLGALAVTFAQQRAPRLIGPQADDCRGVDGMDGPPLTAHAHGLDRQAHAAPGKGPSEQHIEPHLAPLHGAFHSMPAPAQVEHVGQGGTGAAPLMMDKLTAKPSDQHDAKKVCGACRHRVNYAVERTRRQVYWLDGQRLEGLGWFRHPPSIPDFWPPWLRIW